MSKREIRLSVLELEKLGVTLAFPQYPDTKAEENSRRLTACWNACEGISTETLQQGNIADRVARPEQQRDALLAALEPFGYFRAMRYWWTSCDKSDKGAVPLYSQETVNELLKHCDVLAELVAFQRDARLVALKELAIVERQRDLLLEALDRIAWNRKLNEKPSKHVEAMERIAINAIRSAKGGAA